MPIEKLHIADFLQRSNQFPILDVRSPGEYEHAHIPGAFSLPLFSNEERAIIGTAYKQKGREEAVGEGLNFFSSSMKSIPKKALEIFENCATGDAPVFYVHCWRGGMRSEAVAWLLNLYGYKVYLLQGGYKSFRRWANQQFEKKRNYKIIGGYTGSGKTELLNALKVRGENIIDLEQLAHHKGSSFGSLGMPSQPSQEMFENKLAWQLGMNCNDHQRVWLEDESRHIGIIHIPDVLWGQLRLGDLYFLEIPANERLKYITTHYGQFDVESLKAGVLRIQKRLGGLETKNALQYLDKGDISKCFEILLRYYDRLYRASLEKHLAEGSNLHKITCASVDNYNAVAVLDSV